MTKVLTIALVTATLFVAGCQTSQPQLIKQKLVAVTVPDEMWNCPTVKTFPNPDTLTDEQVSKLLRQYAQNNKKCTASIAAVREHLAQAKEIAEQE